MHPQPSSFRRAAPKADGGPAAFRVPSIARSLEIVALLAAVSLSLAARAARPSPAPLDQASWIWRAQTNNICQFRKTFTLAALPASADLLITADNGYELYLNGALLGADIGKSGDIWRSVERYNLAPRLLKERNVIGIRGTDLGGIRGLIAALRLTGLPDGQLEMVTDAGWRTSLEGDPVDYSHPEYVEGPEWSDASIVGPSGMAPWGRLEWKGAGPRKRIQTAAFRPATLSKPGPDFRWPEEVVFLGDDCSVYVPLEPDAWGVCFRIGGWSRAYTEFDLPCPSKIGRKLFALKPDVDAQPRLLFDAGPKGVIGSPSVSYNGRSIHAAMAQEGEDFFHIYRIPSNGGEPRRLTDGPFHDIDPVELPDGRIVFTSTRIGTYEEYHSPPSRSLFTMNADGSNIRPLTFTLIFDNEPKVMADGRIAFIRTDNFFDRAKVETRIEVIRPDGTDGLTEIGANVGASYGLRLRAHGYGSPAPLPDGRLAVISNHGNLICVPGGSAADNQRLPDGLGDLAPLPDGRLLCTVLLSAGKPAPPDTIAVLDPTDNRLVPIHTSTNGAVHSPVYLGRRERPPVLPAATKARGGSGPAMIGPALPEKPATTGFLFCQNARFTTKTGADWSNIRAIRVLQAIPLTIRSSHSHIVHVGHETKELGVVPLASDGSFFIEAPADVPLALQAVDAEGRSELNEMSWIYVRPGERRSCLGCHHPRRATPPAGIAEAQALKTPPLRLVGQGNPHRFRGNNAGVTGMMDLQFERFREVASLNRLPDDAKTDASVDGEVRRLINLLKSGDPDQRISSAQRLTLFRDRAAAPALAACLEDSSRELRVAAAMGLAACGVRKSTKPLLSALDDPDAVIARAAVVALENLTAHREAAPPDAAPQDLARQWRDWFAKLDWNAHERALVAALSESKPNAPGASYQGAPPTPAPTRDTAPSSSRRRILVALGHIGGDAARAALRDFVAAEAATNRYPEFVKRNRTDRFTFSAESPLNPRDLQEAVRALGHLNDAKAIPILSGILSTNLEPRTANLFLAEASIEALGRIGGARAEAALVQAFAAVGDYHEYVGWYSDHPALYACHASPIHARLLEALDRVGCARAGELVPKVIHSVPTDPDRALFAGNDDYERLAGRFIRRNGRGTETIETCLSILGDPAAATNAEIRAALTNTFEAWAGHPGPENRASQILSLTCRDSGYEPRIRAAFERFRALPEEPVERALGNPDWTPVRHWTLFYLSRALGNLGDRKSVDALVAALDDRLNEARHGRPDPSQPTIHFLHLEYTPCWRASAANALGRIGERRALPALLGAVRNLDNATDVRHAAAQAIGRLGDPSALSDLQALAADYPEVSTRRALLASIDALGKRDLR